MKPAAPPPPTPPKNLEDAYKIIVALRHEVVQLREENTSLHSKVAELEEKLRVNSSNSSMPPSSDLPSKKGRKKKSKGKRKRGGQPGHAGKTRELFAKEEVDEFVECPPDKQCECGGEIVRDEREPERRQQLALPKIKPLVLEYLIYSGYCTVCGRFHRGRLPSGTPSGMLDARGMALVSVLSGKYHLSKRSIEELLKDIFEMDIALGTVSATEGRVSEALREPVEEAKQYVQTQDVVHADETSHKMGNRKAWMWVAVTSFVSVFIIRFTRGQEAAKELLGECFGGFLVTDRWGGYNWVNKLQRQLCWAHLLRDFTKIAERGGQSKEIGDKLLEYAQKMFHLWHQYCDGTKTRAEFQLAMSPIRKAVESLLEEGKICEQTKTAGMCKKIFELKEALWTFVDVSGVEPTNNVAERTIRPYVLWRKASFGTQSQRGNTFVERMMTVSATCKIQKRNVLDYVTEAVNAQLRGDVIPSLLPKLPLAEAA